jgi:hypothetical protein
LITPTCCRERLQIGSNAPFLTCQPIVLRRSANWSGFGLGSSARRRSLDSSCYPPAPHHRNTASGSTPRGITIHRARACGTTFDPCRLSKSLGQFGASAPGGRLSLARPEGRAER